MMGDIFGKGPMYSPPSLLEHLDVPNTNTHTHTYKSCKKMGVMKLSHSEQHWLIKKRGRRMMKMSWEYLMLEDVLKIGKGGVNIIVKKLWV